MTLDPSWELLGKRVLAAAVVLVGAWAVGRLVSRGAHRALSAAGRPALAVLVRRVIRLTALAAGLLSSLEQLGLNVASLLAGAGIAGVALGFGAQSLVKDWLSGFFLMSEGALLPGDIVKIGELEGEVEAVGLRSSRIRSLNGALHYVPNGSIAFVSNYNRDWSRAVVHVGVAYESDVGRALRVLGEVGEAWAKQHADLVLEPPEAQGVTALNPSDVGLRLMCKVRPMMHGVVERELRLRVKEAFDSAGIEVGFPRQVAYNRSERLDAVTQERAP